MRLQSGQGLLMKHLLITGGAGFIGANFVRYIMRAEPAVRIVNLDALTYAGSSENNREFSDSDRHVFIKGDICDQALVETLLRQYSIDTVVHFAAESHVDRSITGPSPFIQTNIVGTFTLLEAVRRVWLEEKSLPLAELRFHHVSTDEVYGSLGKDDPAFTETTPYQPNSPYAASKASSDHIVRAYVNTYGLPATITNCSNNYGPFQFPEKLIPLMILNALEQKPLPVYGDGQQVRDWLYVEDHCQAIWMVLQHGRVGETYNIGGGNQPANLEIVQTLCGIMDENFPANAPHASLIRHVTDRPGHDRRYAMDIRKIQAELGWQPKWSLETGLRETMAWYLSHLDWVKTVREQQDYRGWLEKNYAARLKEEGEGK
jgi:dTDP-glucose 4,6-dehydratase